MVLPVVREATGLILQEELLNSEENEYTANLLKRLKKDNPCVANFISTMSLESKDPHAVSYTALLVYRLLEKELESSEPWPHLIG